jgi:hypothetical protein
MKQYDQFYTAKKIAAKCLSTILAHYQWTEWSLVVEPSAGAGSFLSQIPCKNKIGMDIAPGNESVLEQDFMYYVPPPQSSGGRILVVGNPPFGKASSSAVRFFNHAAKWADVIAFILPRTFRRTSVQNRLNTRFHLIFDEDIPQSPCPFVPRTMVKCCFQIWERRVNQRAIIASPTRHKDWTFLEYGPTDSRGQPTPPSGADFAIRACGGKCGDIVDGQLDVLRPKSWHWIKASIDQATLKRRFTTLDYSIGQNTARQNSVGRGDLVRLYSEAYDNADTPT